MSEEIKWFATIFIITPVAWVLRFVWITHKDLQEVKENYPDWSDLNKTIEKCSDDKDRQIKSLKDDTQYIRGRLDDLHDGLMKDRE